MEVTGLQSISTDPVWWKYRKSEGTQSVFKINKAFHTLRWMCQFPSCNSYVQKITLYSTKQKLFMKQEKKHRGTGWRRVEKKYKFSNT